MLDLSGADVLVVGGGPIGARKAAGLADAGALVTVVAPTIVAALADDARISCVRRRFEPSDVEGRRLVITATGIVEVDAAVYRAATAAGIWVNSADDPDHCTFILPAVVRRGPVVVGVSTSGTSPALAQHLRDRIADVVGPEVADAARDLAEQRAEVQRRGGSTEDLDWSAAVEAALERARQDQPSSS
jgi:siroheme synthase-like protein